jgi:EpsI family protein
VVIGLMFWIGSRFADHDDDVTAAPLAPITPAQSASPGPLSPARSPWSVGIAALALVALAQWGYWQLNRETSTAAAPPQLALAEHYGRWQASAQSLTDWTPGFQHARTVASSSYTDGTREAAVWVGYYRDQGYDKKLISSTNQLTSRDLDARWASTEKGTRPVTAPGLSTPMTVAEVRASLSASSTGFQGPGQRLRVWHAYWVGGEWVVGEVQARMRLSLNRLLGKGDDAAVVIFYASAATVAENSQADATLQAWVDEILPALNKQLLATQHQR